MSERTDLSALSADEQAKRAFDRIVRIANKREISSAKMRDRLYIAGFCAKAIDDALDRAITCKYIDDERYAECLIRTTLTAGRGLANIEYEIRSLGIEPYDLEPYAQYMDAGEEMQVERALAVLAHHNTSSKNVYASCLRKLIASGYSPKVASRAVRQHLSLADEFLEDAC